MNPAAVYERVQRMFQNSGAGMFLNDNTAVERNLSRSFAYKIDNSITIQPLPPIRKDFTE